MDINRSACRGLTRRGVIASTAAMLTGLVPGSVAAEDVKRYHSDYFSFVGSDPTGTVYLAHDNNRGQTGEQFFADHWIFMYAEGNGVIPVVGSAHYPNPGKALEFIPNSEHFQFEGSLVTGMRLRSVSNDIELAVAPLTPILRRQQPGNDTWIGATAAVLRWKGRTLQGRVIFEFIARTGFNRFTSDFGSIWNNFNGLYLRGVEGGDLYLRHHEKMQADTPRDSGMSTIGGIGVLENISFEVLDSRVVADRPYRWPERWRVAFKHGGANWTLEAETMALEEIADWKTGGFAMSIIKGRARRTNDNVVVNVEGMAELLI